jgi:MHS family proline/betaine transporter-like MFS transporter
MVRLLARVIGIGIDRMTSALARLGVRGFKPHAGCCPAAYAELFPTRVRYTALSIGYNIAVAIFGGFAPFIATWLIKETGNPLAPAFYVVAAAVITFVILTRIRETAFSPLK